MRKKYFIIIVAIILTLATTLFAYGVIADENLNIIDAEYTDQEGWHSSLLYSDNRMLMWDSEGKEEIIENVKKRIHPQYTTNKPVYLTYDNKLNYETKTGNKVIENVLDFEIGKINDEESIVYINDKKELHYIPYYEMANIDLSKYGTRNLTDVLEVYGELDALSDYEENDNQVIIYYFYSDYCSYCSDLIISLRELDAEILNKIKMVAFNVYNDDNDELMLKVKEYMGNDIDSAIPYMVIGETNILGLEENYIDTIISSVETLYEMEVSERPDIIDLINEDIKETSYQIASNVEKIVFNEDKYGDELLVYLDSNNILRSYDNFYGEVEGVKEIGENYFLTENNELYYMTTDMYTRLATNVTKVVSVKKYENINLVFEVLDSNDSQYFVYYDVIYDDYFHGYYGPEMKDVIIYDEIMGDAYYLTQEGKLLVDFDDDSEGFIEVTTNVKEIHRNIDNEAIMILYNTGELYYKCFGTYCYGDEFIDEMTGQTAYYKDVDYKVLENVETIKYYDKYYILMSDKSVYRYGFNDINQFKENNGLYISYVPVQIDELINDGSEIETKYIKLNLENTKGIIGNNIYTNPIVIPANTNSKITLSSSNENVATINKSNNVVLHEKGTSTICAMVKEDNQIKDCSEINTYLPINEISIEEKEIWLKEYDEYLLTINAGPEGCLEESIDIGWEINSENEDAIDIETEAYYDYLKGEYVLLEPNQILITARAGGTYELKLKQKGCKTEECIQTLKVNIEEDIYRIDVVIDEEYFDGQYNAYMFINENNKLQVNYKQYTETSTTKKVLYSSSDPTIASIDENGLITAHKEGEVMITLTADDESQVSTSFTLNIYNYDTGNVKKGDVNKDGEINILDIIKLRKYLAGLEDLEE